VAPLHSHLHHAVALYRGSHILLAGFDMTREEPQHYQGLDHLRHSQMAWDWQLQLQTVGSLSLLKTDILNGHGYIVSDGSYHNEAGAAAWIIEG